MSHLILPHSDPLNAAFNHISLRGNRFARSAEKNTLQLLFGYKKWYKLLTDNVLHLILPIPCEISGLAMAAIKKTYHPCPLYWDWKLNWIEGSFNPQEWMVDTVLKQIRNKQNYANQL